MTHPHPGDPLRPMLREAETDLAERLEEACAKHDVSRETTGELMRLEETLLEAARAAKQAVSVRRRLRSLGASKDGATSAPNGDGAPSAEGDALESRDGSATTTAASAATKPDDEPDSVRDFVDEHRVEWRVWEVIPGRNGAGTHAEHQLGAFQAGWLAFEAIASGDRRRLRDYPHDWNRLSNDELESLLARAEAGRSARRPSGEQQQQQQKTERDAPRD